MRKRMIDPEFWTDEKMCLLPRDVRLFFIGLWNFADDEGRFQANPVKLKAQIFPVDTDITIEKIKEFLKMLEEQKRILIYGVNGNTYGCIVNFKKYQAINRPTPSKLPPPPENLNGFSEYSVNTHGVFSEYSVSIHDNLKEKESIQRKRKEVNRIEEKRKEENINNIHMLGTEQSSVSEQHKKINFNFENQTFENITDKDKEKWKEAFPACDIDIELARMREWLLANPHKRKKNYRRFIVNWLTKMQDKGGTRINGNETDKKLLEEAISSLSKLGGKDRIKKYLKILPRHLWGELRERYLRIWKEDPLAPKSFTDAIEEIEKERRGDGREEK